MNRATRSLSRPAAATAALVLGGIALAGCSGGSGAASTAPAASPSASSGASASSVDPNAAAPAAAADIPDNQAFVPFTPAGASFAVSVPEGWSRTSPGPSTTTFTDKLNSVTIETSQQAQAPTVASVESTELAAVSSAATNYQAGKTQQVTRKAGSVIESTYRADSAPNAVTSKVVNDDVSRYVYHRSGTEVVLTLSSPHGADSVDAWKIVTDSFTWT